MKKFILTSALIFGVFCTQMTYGQSSSYLKDELNIEINDGFPPSFIMTFADVFSSIIRGDQVNSDTKTSPFFSISYNHFLSPKFAIGLDIGYYRYESHKTFKDNDTQEKSYSDTKWTLYSIAPNIKYI